MPIGGVGPIAAATDSGLPVFSRNGNAIFRIHQHTGTATIISGTPNRHHCRKLTVTPRPLAPGELELSGDIVVSGYPVKLSGKVTAVVCPKQ